MALLGQHRLAFHHLTDLMFRQDIQHDLIVFLSIAGPVDVNTALSGLLFELDQIVGQSRERVTLDLTGQRPQVLPFGHRPRGLVAFGTDNQSA